MTSPARPKLRRDTQETRDHLLDTVERLLARQGPTFTLPDLAREAGVGSSTVYRHFDSVHEAHREFFLRATDRLVARLAHAARDADTGIERFEAVCGAWVEAAMNWASAGRHMRSAEGIVERVRRREPAVWALAQVLEGVLSDLISAKMILDQDLEYAVLIWVTIFDERVIFDLRETMKWSASKSGQYLGRSVLRALGGPYSA